MAIGSSGHRCVIHKQSADSRAALAGVGARETQGKVCGYCCLELGKIMWKWPQRYQSRTGIQPHGHENQNDTRVALFFQDRECGCDHVVRKYRGIRQTYLSK